MDFDHFGGKNDGSRVTGVKVPLKDGASITVAAWLNPKHSQAIQRYTKGKNALLQAGVFDTAESERLFCRAMSEAVLLGWDGMTENGEPLAYTTAMAERVLFERPGFRGFVVQLSQEEETFRAGEDDETGKD